MINGYNDDTLLKENKRLERHTQFKIMRNTFSQKGKPSKYKINLISLGRVGYSFAEQLLNYMEDDESFIELNIWHRVARKIEDGNVVDMPPNRREMYKTLLKIMTGQRKNFHLHDYRTLQDLEKIVRDSNNNPPVGDITIVTPRYDFSFQKKDTKNKPLLDENKNPIKLDPSEPTELALIESICQTSIYDNSADPQTIMKKVIEERAVMEDIVNKVTKETGLRRDRAENLIDSVMGIKELANAFRDYKGNTIIVANEIDTTAYVFAKQSGTNPHKTLGLSHNDQIRYEEFLRDNIPKALRDLQLNVPLLGSHNEFITPVYDMILLNDELISDTIKNSFDFEKLKQQVADFGLNLFKAQGSSDKDAPKAILHTIKSIMYEDFRDDHVVRASTQFKDEDFFTGIQIHHDNGVAIPHNLEELLLKMNPSEKEIFEKGNEIQKFINNELVEKGIIPREWSYQEPKPKEPSVIIITEKPIEKPTIYISTGNQHEVLETKLGDFKGFKPILRSHIGDGEHFAGPIKIKKHKGIEYLLLGTSQGIIAQELDNNHRDDYLIGENDLEKGYVIWSMELIGNQLFGSYSKGQYGKGIIKWNFEASKKKGKLIYKGNTYKTKQLDDTAIIFSENNLLYMLETSNRKIKKYHSFDNGITALDSIDDLIVVGDNQGQVIRVDSNHNEKQVQANLSEENISAIHCIKSNNRRYSFVGDSQGLMTWYDLENMKKMGWIPFQKIVKDEKRGPRINNILYYPQTGIKWAFIEIGNKLLQYNLASPTTFETNMDRSYINLFVEKYEDTESGLHGLAIRI